MFLWSLEAAFLFWLGRSKKIELLDYLSFVLISITFILTVTNWVSVSYPFYKPSISQLFMPVLSLEFLASAIVILSFTFIYYIHKKFTPSGERILNWLSLSGSTEVYKHGLSILWGVLSFILVGYGIWKRKNICE